MSKKRIVFRVKYRARNLKNGTLPWTVVEGDTTFYFPTAVTAIRRARDWARIEWAAGKPAQVVVHGRNGRIRFENTYGHDPERSKG